MKVKDFGTNQTVTIKQKMQINLASHGDQRVAIFIDTQNLYHSAKSNYRANVNYEELIKVAVGGRRLVRAFAYVIRSEENTEGKFFEALEDIGIETRVKDLQIFHTGAKKADWDVGIAVDMIRLTEKVDVVVLASGDGDFLEVVRYCQSRGVRVELMAFEKTTNAKIMEEVDHFTDLGDLDSDFLIGNRRNLRPRAKTSPDTFFNNAPAQVLPPSLALEKGSDYLAAKQAHVAARPTGYQAKPVVIKSPYGGSNLSSINRVSGNAVQKVSPSIFGRNNRRKTGNPAKNRRIKPVVGLPAAPISSVFGGKTLINDETKNKPSVNNAFGNQEPKKRFFN